MSDNTVFDALSGLMKHLAHVRTLVGISWEEMAQKMGCGVADIMRLEQEVDKYPATFHTLQAYADALGYPFSVQIEFFPRGEIHPLFRAEEKSIEEVVGMPVMDHSTTFVVPPQSTIQIPSFERDTNAIHITAGTNDRHEGGSEDSPGPTP